jgi:DNA-binding CsgD family transcriptional regulator
MNNKNRQFFNDDSESILYVVSWEGTPEVVKIGRTTNFAQRSNNFLTAHHEPLIVRCLCPEDVMSEHDLHMRHESARITLEHFHYTIDLKDTVEMLNASTRFTEYTIPRTKAQTGIADDVDSINTLKQNMNIPPIRISRAELQVAELAALGATVKDTAEALDMSEVSVKAHRQSITQKGFMGNLCSSLIKLAVHGVLDLEKLRAT